MKNKEIKNLILGALKESEYKWRTARGISKDTKIPMDKVVDFLEKSSEILRAKKSNNKGQALYTTRDKYRKTTPLSKRVLSALINEVG